MRRTIQNGRVQVVGPRCRECRSRDVSYEGEVCGVCDAMKYDRFRYRTGMIWLAVSIILVVAVMMMGFIWLDLFYL